MNHGHVIPNPDGSKARCGGPAMCPQCALELGVIESEYKNQLTKDSITPEEFMKSLESKNLSQKLRAIEFHYIKDALIDAKWNSSKAANILGIGRGNLQNRMKKLKLETPLQLVRRKQKVENGTN